MSHGLISRAFRSADVDPKYAATLMAARKTFTASGGWDPIPSASEGLKTVSVFLHDRAEQIEAETQRRMKVKCDRLERWYKKTGQTPFDVFGYGLHEWLNSPRMSLKYYELTKHLKQ